MHERLTLRGVTMAAVVLLAVAFAGATVGSEAAAAADSPEREAFAQWCEDRGGEPVVALDVFGTGGLYCWHPSDGPDTATGFDEWQQRNGGEHS